MPVLPACAVMRRVWMVFRRGSMFFRMKTTLILPDPVYRKLKRLATERGETLSHLVTELLRRGLAYPPERSDLPDLPSRRVGEILVDLDDREELYRVLDEETDPTAEETASG